MTNPRFNPETTHHLESLNHPLFEDIQQLRNFILTCNEELVENTKWNAPNYSMKDIDCLTMKIMPPKNILLIFHRGAKVTTALDRPFIEDPFQLLEWKDKNHAILSFKNFADIESNQIELKELIRLWTSAIETHK